MLVKTSPRNRLLDQFLILREVFFLNGCYLLKGNGSETHVIVTLTQRMQGYAEM